jgi:hypothetical protein
MTLRRQIQTFKYSKLYNDKVEESIIDFFKDNELPYLHIVYEDLILRPNEVIGKLNSYLKTNLEVGDLKKIYNKRLYKKPRSYIDFIKAVLIYLKNYPARLK